MSSTGIKTDIYDNLEADIINVNDSLFIKKINILDFINDLSENLVDLSENLVDLSENLVDLSGNLVDLSGYIINNIFDLSGNINNNINDISQNIYDLSQNLTDLSENVQGIKNTNTLQDLQLFEHGGQISVNTDALVTLGGIVTTNVAATGANTVTIAGIIGTLGVPSTAITPGTGIYGSIDSKTSRSLFGSGNVAIYGTGSAEYINLVYNNEHFEDIKLISNNELNLKEPYKSLPSVVNTKQNIFTCISPLIKNDISNNISIDLSSYVLKTNFDLSFNDISNKKQNIFTCISPLIKNDISNNISIDLSGYVLKTNFDLSFNDISNKKQNIFTCISPLIKNDISNNISIDLSGYVLKTNFDLSFNDISNKKQDKLIFTTPLIKDISNNVSINLSDYNIGNIKGTKATLNEGYLDPSGNSLIFYHNNAGTYFTDNSFNSFFNLSSATVTNTGLAIVPFITNYNRMFKNGINNAIKIASSGSSNSGVNSSTYILLDSGSNPTPGANVGTIKFNIATFSEGAVDRFVITPTASTFYNQVGIGKSPGGGLALDVSGNLYVSGNINGQEIYENNESLITKYATNANLNLKQDIITCISPLLKDISSNITIDLSAYPLKINVDASLNNLQNKKQDNITCLLPLSKDISNNISINLSDYALKNSLNVSNVTSGTLPVSFGGIGTTTLNDNQILIGNGTNALLQSDKLIWDNSSNGLGIGITQFFNNRTSFQVNNRRLWVDSSPNNSISILSTDKYGTASSENYIQLMENVGIDFRGNLEGHFNFRFATQYCMTLDKLGATVKNLVVDQKTTSGDISTNTLQANTATINTNLNVLGELVVNAKLYGANATSKSLIKFQTKLNQNQLYYYNLDIEKYYKTGQNINGKDYKIFNLTSWAEDGFSIINKCTVYTSTEGSGIKYIMFYDNWGGYLPNGNQSGWQRDNNVSYMTFLSTTQKNIITILENLL